MKTNSFQTALIEKKSDDHHKTYTFLKTKFEKFEPKKLIYRNFKQFDIDNLNRIFVIVYLLGEPSSL